jgi:hypothetical protein
MNPTWVEWLMGSAASQNARKRVGSRTDESPTASLLDRLRALGNSLVPQIAQWLGERIVAYEQAQEARVEAAEEVA